MGYRISELARRSGFPPSTLRYYETVGLLPVPDRTAAGYRSYDDDALARLAFIARAKTMGLALDDIRDLVALWADGYCAPVQDRLRDLLDRKVGEVGQQLAELSRFARQLDHIRQSLAAAAPATPPPERCGPGCPCDTGPEPAPAPEAIRVPIDCTLSPIQAADRTAAWVDLLSRASSRQATPNGVRLGLPADPELVARAAGLSVQETDCCAFFSFQVTVTASGVWLDVAAPPDAQPMLDGLFAIVGQVRRLIDREAERC